MDQTRLAEIAARHHIRLVLQFGSSVTGHMHPGSDIDLAVLLDHLPESLDAELDLIADLQNLVGSREVDVAIINRADPLFLKQIMEHARLLYGSSRQLAELEMYAFRRYQDHRRYLAMEREYLDRTIGAPTPRR